MIIKTIIVFLVTFVSWLLFTFSLDTEEVIVGFTLSAGITAATMKIMPFEKIKCSRLGFIFVPVYLGYLVYSEVMSHFDVCKRIITGKISPAILKVDTSLKSEAGRALLGNSITITPGTLSMTVGESLYVHHLQHDVTVSPTLEKIIKRIFP